MCLLRALAVFSGRLTQAYSRVFPHLASLVFTFPTLNTLVVSIVLLPSMDQSE